MSNKGLIYIYIYDSPLLNLRNMCGENSLLVCITSHLNVESCMAVYGDPRWCKITMVNKVNMVIYYMSLLGYNNENTTFLKTSSDTMIYL